MPIRGAIRVPSDKSISHRAVLFAGLAQGVSHLSGVSPSADVRSTIAAVEALGAHVSFSEDERGLSGSIEGISLEADAKGTLEIDCGNSGTTARLLMGVLAGLGIDAVLKGDASLSARPMLRVIDPLCALGACIQSTEGKLPVHVLAGHEIVAASTATQQASAQVKSALLLAGMQAEGLSCVTEPSKSRDHTERLLPAFGVPVKIDGLTSCVEGPAHLCACDLAIPGDPSSAAFVAVAAALCGGSDVKIDEIVLNATRIGAFEVLRRMGCSLEYEDLHEEGSESLGTVHVQFAPALKSTVVTAQEIPSLIDEIPVLALAAAFADGETVFESCGELRVKECDRFSAIIDGLGAFGVHAFGSGDDLHVIGRPQAGASAPAQVALQTHHDHRLAMVWHIAGLVFGTDVELDDKACVAVSWPDFFEDMQSLQI